MNNPFDIGTPEMQSLRDYLDAVSSTLSKQGADAEDIEQIRSEICELVSNKIGDSEVSEATIESIVRSLDPPESYAQNMATEASIQSEPIQQERKVKPWMVVTGVGAFLLIAILAVVITCAAVFISQRNKIVLSDKVVDAAAAQVEVVLQRRFDLIPNLVETVKGYAKHEAEVFAEVTRLRSQWQNSKDPEEKRGFAIEIEPQIGKLMAVAEQYPNLRANQNFLTLQTQLESTENRIATERRRMNLAVRDYNALIELFPGNLVASILNYETKEQYYEATPDAHTAPKVTF